MLFAWIRAVCVNGAVFGNKQLGEDLAVVHVACGEVGGFDEVVFVNVDVNFETVGAGFLAIDLFEQGLSDIGLVKGWVA
jgi:hypothetical protein